MSLLGIAVVAGRTTPPEPVVAASSTATPSPAAAPPWRRSSADLVERITAYDPFCPGCAAVEPVEPLPPLSPAPPGIELIDPREGPTSLPWDLVATLEATPPGRSLATITDGVRTGLFAEGDEIIDDVTLLAVDAGVVHLQVGDDVEYLPLEWSEPRVAPRSKTPPRPAPARPKRSRYELEGAREAISCQGTSCTIDRRFVNELLARPAQLVSQGRATPYSSQGLRGFRLSRVRAGTIPRLLGLRSGDVLTAINGHPLESLDGAMSMYTRLRHASHLTIEVVRNQRGQRQPMKLDIDIV